MKKFLASRGVGGALGGWGAPLAVAPGAALPWWRNPPPPIDNAQLIASSGAVPTSEPTSRPALRRVRRGFGPSNSPGDGDSSTASTTLAFAPASRAASIAVIASIPCSNCSSCMRNAVPSRCHSGSTFVSARCPHEDGQVKNAPRDSAHDRGTPCRASASLRSSPRIYARSPMSFRLRGGHRYRTAA